MARERIIGEFIAADRAHFVLATKYTLNTRHGDPNACGNHRKNMVQSLEASLKRLQTDYIDLYWVHAWDFLTPVEEVMRGLDDLVRAGKVLYVGISDTPAWVIAQANTLAELRGWTPFVGLQSQYSLIERTAERELLPMARALDIAVLPWGMLGSGVLSGKYNRGSGEGGRVAGIRSAPRVCRSPQRWCRSQRNSTATPSQVASPGCAASRARSSRCSARAPRSCRQSRRAAGDPRRRAVRPARRCLADRARLSVRFPRRSGDA